MTTACSSTFLSLFWACNILTGIGIAVSSIRLYGQVQSTKQRIRQREAKAALIFQRDQQEAMFILQREREAAALVNMRQEEEERNRLTDECIDCAECHPSRDLLFQHPRLCRKHAQLAQGKATSQPQSIAVFPSLV